MIHHCLTAFQGRRPSGCRPFLSALLLALLPGTGMFTAAVAAAPDVAIVRSDDTRLPAPAPATSRLDYHRHVLPMVRLAAAQGGLQAVLDAARPGADGIVDVVCKVNIVHAEYEQGDITNWRVVKALLEVVHEWTPGARLTIAEGGVWIPPQRQDLIRIAEHVEVGDGFQTAGYRALLSDPDLAGVDLRIVDLNYDEAVAVEPAGGGLVSDSYWVPRTVLDADVMISVPVLKITGAVGMTVAVKNLIGIGPGLKYGWSKSTGWPPDSGNPGLWHTARTLDETITDLANVAGVDFALVDAVVGMERARITADGGIPVRTNMIIAGNDLFAVDAVAARLMGMNPDDMEFLQLGRRQGLGEGRLEHIRIHGDIETLARPFVKHPADWGTNGEYGHYGMSNRTWILRGPTAIELDEPPPLTVRPQAGSDGWSGPVYFHDDKIDLDRHFQGPTHAVVWAYAEFDAPRTESAWLWIGSDESLTIWIDGQQAYDFEGRRRHRLPNHRVPIELTEGRHQVLVRAVQRRGDFDFSVKISDGEQDRRYDGNTPMGLRWRVPNPADEPEMEVRVIGDSRQRRAEWFEEQNVELMSPGRVALSAYLPWYGRASWVRLEWPRVWGDKMALEGSIDGGVGRINLDVDNTVAFRLLSEGPLAAMVAPMQVYVGENFVGTAAPNFGELRVALTEAGTWALSPSETIDWDQAALAGVAAETLTRDSHPPEAWDSDLGNWFCDGIRFATGADVAFQNNPGIRTDMAQEPISIRDLFAMNYPNDLLSFERTGRQLLAILEHDVRDGKDRPMQISGVSYVFDRSLPEGQRIVTSDIEPDHMYTIAAEGYLVNRGIRFFGEDIADGHDTGSHIVDALVRYARHQGTVMAPPQGRIRQRSR